MKKKNIKKIIYLIFIILLYFLIKNFSCEINFNSNDKFLRYITSHSNNILTDKEKESLISFENLYKLKDIINTEYKYLYEVNKTTPVNKEVIINKPLVYIYNTHQKEKYSLSNEEIYNIVPTVMTTSYMLEEQFLKHGIKSIVEESSVSNVLNKNNWNYAGSYKVTEMFLNNIVNKYSTLEYFIDVHRDSVKKSITTIEIDNVKYARVLFVIGLENKNYEKNLKIVEYINNKINKKYPKLSRGIYKKKGVGVNGVYNQHFSPNTMLIEFGGHENTIDEVYNTVKVITEILSDYIGEQNEK